MQRHSTDLPKVSEIRHELDVVRASSSVDIRDELWARAMRQGTAALQGI